MKRYEIYFVALDPTIEAEIQKTRPCVIISPPELDYLQTRLIAPITSKGFEAPYRIKIKLLDKDGLILCDQIRCVSTSRLVSKITELDTKSVKALKSVLKKMF
ncbi:type II toxin-antitoxin system PemK/MazF family toxin [Campylobacter mucosalis]|uniref:Toxin-antitoxin system, toxin component, PemK family n=1 Tax=Campylobacter mucosalis CCUG 21559 TaxID=1032067 RepID=A0A6G5QJ18_9BACT|nr:type II toxin-antitoxin system PemK/MazF family toxin [Campylobacter mucosalis]QCD45651.1 toxin-antitoxin system, toxin component, PemK family [Campylobacter mucosalis CCUG 21559]